MTVRKRALLVLGGLGVGYALAWTAWPLHLPVMCPFRRITGMPCGACGLTHAFCALARGDVGAAVNFHVGVLPLAAVAGAVGVMTVAELLGGRPLMGEVWHRGKRMWVAGAWAIFVAGWTVNLMKYWSGAG